VKKRGEEEQKVVIMRIWILLFAIASMQFAVDAMPSKSNILYRKAEGDFYDIFSNIPDDVDADEILRRLEDVMNREVRRFAFKSDFDDFKYKNFQPGSILDGPIVCAPGYRPNSNNICKPIL
jgi:hypothetical protein